MVIRSPISGGKPVTLGFHSLRLTYGEDYRDFFEVMEFTKKETSTDKPPILPPPAHDPDAKGQKP